MSLIIYECNLPNTRPKDIALINQRFALFLFSVYMPFNMLKNNQYQDMDNMSFRAVFGEL